MGWFNDGMYFNCEICGKYGDEGGLVPYIKEGRRWIHVCEDCSWKMDNEKIIRLFEEKEKKKKCPMRN